MMFNYGILVSLPPPVTPVSQVSLALEITNIYLVLRFRLSKFKIVKAVF